MNRRAFLTALSAAPVAALSPAFSPRANAGVPAARSSAGLVVPAGQDRRGRPLRVFGGLRIDAKLAPADTGGDLYVIEHTDEAKGGPPRHVHHAQDEWFRVLGGAYRLEIGDERFELAPGDCAFAPRGVPHVWAHTGEGEGRLLIAFQPAGQMEAFLEALSQAGDAPTRELLRPLFEAHGMSVVGPPLAV